MSTEACSQASGWGRQSSLFRPLEQGFRSLVSDGGGSAPLTTALRTYCPTAVRILFESEGNTSKS